MKKIFRQGLRRLASVRQRCRARASTGSCSYIEAAQRVELAPNLFICSVCTAHPAWHRLQRGVVACRCTYLRVEARTRVTEPPQRRSLVAGCAGVVLLSSASCTAGVSSSLCSSVQASWVSTHPPCRALGAPGVVSTLRCHPHHASHTCCPVPRRSGPPQPCSGVVLRVHGTPHRLCQPPAVHARSAPHRCPPVRC